MAPRNPSELTRLYEELDELFADIKNGTRFYPKAQRQGILNQIHAIQETLGLPLYAYNGDK